MVHRYFLDLVAAGLASASLFLFALANPVVGPILGFFAPAPLVWATCRHGPKKGLLGIVLSTSFVLPFVSLPAVISFSIGNSFLGWFLGIQLHRRRGIVFSSFLASLLILSLSLLSTSAHLLAAGLDVVPFLKYQIGDLMREAQQALEQIALQSPPDAEVNVTALLSFFTRAFPAFIFITVALEGMANSGLTLLFLSRRDKGASFQMPDYSTFKLHESLIWPLIIAMALLWAPSVALHVVALNATFVMLFLYLIQGLSISLYFLKKRGGSRPLRMIVIIAFLLQPYLLALPLLAGLLDFKFDFRTPRVPSPPPPDGTSP
jgi:uncharacterized protein YybS (DUF2232 family)